MSLTEYKRKRDFSATPEPRNSTRRKGGHRRFVIQKHEATRLHFDLRLELGGTLVSWAVPKGLPLLHGDKRLAIKVEDHPLSYFNFEGSIPKGQYGGGTVQVWDIGTFEPLTHKPAQDLKNGKLHFALAGQKLTGDWYLVRLPEDSQWLIVRGATDHRPVPRKLDEASVLTGRTMAEIARGKPGKNGFSIKNVGSTRTFSSPPDKPSTLAKTPFRPQPPQIPSRLSIPASEFIEPMMAKQVATPPDGVWEYEVKFDGFRAVAFKRGKTVDLMSRTRHSMDSKFPEISRAVQNLKVKEAVFDGEIVALDEGGRSSFQLLQAYEMGEEAPPLVFYVFDLLRLNGKDLCPQPLHERRKKLEALISENEPLRFSPCLGRDAGVLLKIARAHGLEGLIGKKERSAYEPGRRSGSWIKLKLTLEQEFVIGGYTQPSGSRAHLGALLLGYYHQGKLRFAGKVGSGFSSKRLETLRDHFASIRGAECPFSDLPESRGGRYGQGMTATAMKNCRWVKPVLVAQVKFSEWTREGRLRQPVFIGLRDDRPAKEVVRESPG